MIHIRTRFLAVLSGLLVCMALSAQEPPKPKPADAKPAPAWLGEIDKIRKDNEAACTKIYTEMAILSEATKTKTEAEQEAVMKPFNERLDKERQTAGDAILKALRTHEAEAEAAEPLAWVVANAPRSGETGSAVELLKTHHPVHEKTVEMVCRNSRAPLAWTADFMKAQLASPKLPPRLRPKVLRSLAAVHFTLSQFPSIIAESDPVTLAQLERIYGKKTIEARKSIDVAKAEAEAVALLEELIAKHADAILIQNLTYGEYARNAIFEIRDLAPGRPAPEIEGKDTDGKPMKLSDYRGKVVLLSFWGTWCGPCMAAIPHERELARKYEGKPFAIVGINSDTDAKELKAAIETNGITWRSFDCGEKGPLGPIPMKWNVTGWPTMILIDAKGVIRSRNVAGATMDERIDALLKDSAK